MKTLKELKQEAKQKGVKNYSRIKKAELEEILENLPEEPYKIQASKHWKEEEKKEKKFNTLMKKIKKPMDILKEKVDVLRKATQEIIPEKVSETIEKSVKTGMDYLKSIWEKRKLLTEEARKKVKKIFLDFNKKIADLWKKQNLK